MPITNSFKPTRLTTLIHGYYSQQPKIWLFSFVASSNPTNPCDGGIITCLKKGYSLWKPMAKAKPKIKRLW